MHGSPCQDFSVAGKQAGGDEGSGTRSSLMYETLRIVEKLQPKYVIWENVKNLLGKKHKHNWEAYCQRMDELGYTSHGQVLNAKDFGIPQNRERVFTVSIREDIAKAKYLRSATAVQIFEFPEPFPLEKKLKDILDDEVDEKYYLKKTDNLVVGSSGVQWDNSGKGYGSQQDRAYYQDGIGPSLSCSNNSGDKAQVLLADKDEAFCVAQRGRGEKGSIEQHFEPRFDGATNTLTSVQKDNYVAIKTANKQGYDLATDGDGIDLAYPNSTTRRGRVGHEVSKTLECGAIMGTLQNYRIRKLTPKECWRLMGFDDSDFEKAEKVNSNSQLYKQAGNSIVVNVLEGILKNLLENEYGR
jgi:DNA (cytosine-5)-methyltransferase 1